LKCPRKKKKPTVLDPVTEESIKPAFEFQSRVLDMLPDFFRMVPWSSVVLKPQHLPEG
jgi:hypothetical protein